MNECDKDIFLKTCLHNHTVENKNRNVTETCSVFVKFVVDSFVVDNLWNVLHDDTFLILACPCFILSKEIRIR